MSGILPAKWANFFTRATNYEVDFSNFGKTLTTQGVSGYSAKQIADRAYIWGGIVLGGVSGYLLNQLRNDESGNPATALAISLGVIAGFTYTHHQVTKQRISFRKKMTADIEELKHEVIEKILITDNETPKKVLDVVKNILALEAFDDSKSIRAMRTLYIRKEGLKLLLEKLNETVESSYWKDNDTNQILSDLKITEAHDASPKPH